MSSNHEPRGELTRRDFTAGMLGGLVSPLVACGANATTSSCVTLSDGQPG